MRFDDWDNALRRILVEREGILDLGGGRVWSVNNRLEVLNKFKPRIFDRHLNAIRDICVLVLKEVDPKFNLDAEKRYAAHIYGALPRFSEKIRASLIEIIAWLGVNSECLANCSDQNKKYISLLIVRDIFKEADWKLWGSLNRYLPELAEAAPSEFLRSVESALLTEPSPFDALFSQEDTGIMGENYLTGLYWALESLAWHEEYLSVVCVTLAGLAEHDPGGRWANRPANSLVTILLPWHPQTLAAVEKRVAAMRAVCVSSPQVAWKVLLKLLPSMHQTTMGSHKPKWRNPLPDDWRPEVSHQEYWEQVKAYAAMAVDMGCSDIDRAKELVVHFDNIPEPSFTVFLDFLASDFVINLDELERTPIWEKLSGFISKHRRHHEQKWALPVDVVDRLALVAEKIVPQSPVYLYGRLFGDHDYELYEDDGSWKEQTEKLEERRREAIQEIILDGGIDRVISFASTVKNPSAVGFSLAGLGDNAMDGMLLPKLLCSEEVTINGLISNYVWGRFHRQGWQWVDSLSYSAWTEDQRSQFLICLPFEKSTWDRTQLWLGNNEASYWEKAGVNPYATEDDLLPAVDKLLEVGRPAAAVDCLYARIHKRLPVDFQRSFSALQMAATGGSDIKNYGLNHATELIKALQEAPEVPFEDLCRIEYLYLPILRGYDLASPVMLEKKLSRNPDFFAQIISHAYLPNSRRNEDVAFTEEERDIANNVWRLLMEWKTPPGLEDDGSFSGEKFHSWLVETKRLCQEMDRLDVALLEVGKVLRYTPPDPSGFWIHKGVLDALNARDAKQMRDGFSNEVFNSRGVHNVDPSGAPERALAAQWREKAKDVEMLGYALFAAELSSIADSYDRDAERVIRDYGDRQ